MTARTGESRGRWALIALVAAVLGLTGIFWGGSAGAQDEAQSSLGSGHTTDVLSNQPIGRAQEATPPWSDMAGSRVGRGHDLAFDAGRDLLYVSLIDGQSIAAMDPDDGTIVDVIPVGDTPRGIELSATGDKLYVALNGGIVLELDLATRDTREFDARTALGFPSGAWDLLVVDEDRLLVSGSYVASIDLVSGQASRVASGKSVSGARGLLQRAGQGSALVVDYGGIYRLDTSQADSPIVAENTDFRSGSTPVAVTADGEIAYGFSEIVRTHDLEIIGTTPTSGFPALSADGAHLFHRSANNLSILEISTGQVTVVRGGCANHLPNAYASAIDESGELLFWLSSGEVCLGQPDGGSASLAGRVVTPEGEPIAEAHICASSNAGRVGGCATSDTDGAYVIVGLRTGTYEVQGAAPGFLNACYQDPCDYSNSRTFGSVAVGLTPIADVDISLTSVAPGAGWNTEDLLPGYSDGFVLDAQRGLLYVAMPWQRGIAVLDADTGELIDQVLLVGEPRGLELSTDGDRLYVALASLGSVAAIDLATYDYTLIDLWAELASAAAWDVLQLDDQHLIVSSSLGYLVAVDLDSGVARRIADDRQLGSEVLLYRAGPDSAIAMEGTYLRDLHRIDVSQPDMPIVAQSDPDQPVRSQIAVSPDGAKVYAGHLVLRSSDLSVVGQLPSSGRPVLSPDGSRLIQLDSNRLVVVSDAQASRQLAGFASACDLGALPMTAIDPTGTWLYGVSATSACVDRLTDDGGSLAGEVTSADSELPLSGARVCAVPAVRGETRCSVANASGQYVLDSLRPGSYRVQFAAAGYVSRCFGQLGCGFDATVEVGSVALTEIDGRLDPAPAGAAWGVAPQLPGDGHDLVLDETRGLAYVSIPSAGSVALVDTSTGRVADEVLVTGSPRGMALSADGRELYVALWGTGAVGVVDLHSRQSHLAYVDYAFANSDRIWDVLEIESGRVLVSTDPQRNSSARLVVLDAATGQTMPVEGGWTLQAPPVFERVSDDAVLVAANSMPELLRIDVTQPEVAVDHVGPLRVSNLTPNPFAVAPDGELAYLSSHVVRTSDLQRIADLPFFGHPAITPDGKRLVQRWHSGIGIVDAQSLRLLEGYGSPCSAGWGAHVAETVIDSAGTTLFSVIGSTVCADNIAESAGSISGLVSVRGVGDPIAGVRVCAVGSRTFDRQHCSLTDADGSYTVSPLRADTYTVRYSVGGYEQQCPDDVGCTYSTEIAVANGAVMGVDVELDRVESDSAWGYEQMLARSGLDAVLDAERRLIYVSQHEGPIAVIDALTGRLVEEIELRGSPRGMDLMSDGNRLVVALADVGSVAVIDLSTRTYEEFYVGDELRTPDVSDVVDVGANRVLVLAPVWLDSIGGLVLLDLTSGERRVVARDVIGGEGLIRSGARVYVTQSESGYGESLVWIDLDDPEFGSVRERSAPSLYGLEQMAIDADGTSIYLSRQVVRLGDPVVVEDLPRVGRPVLSADGSRLVQRNDDGTVSITDTATLEVIGEFTSECGVVGTPRAMILDPLEDRLLALMNSTICEDRLDGSGDLAPHVSHTVSCLSGNGRVDTNIVNRSSEPSRFRMVFQGLSPRETTVAPLDWWRSPITGRPDGTYSILVFRDGNQVAANTVNVLCDEDPVMVGGVEIEVINACRFGNGYILFQFLNLTAETRGWVIEFGSIPRRSTSAPGHAASVRAVTGRPDGQHNWRVRTGDTWIASGTVTVDCDT